MTSVTLESLAERAERLDGREADAVSVEELAAFIDARRHDDLGDVARALLAKFNITKRSGG